MNQTSKVEIKNYRKRRLSSPMSALPLPADEKIASLAALIAQHKEKECQDNQYASVKKVLSLLGMGVFIGSSFIAPGILIAAKPFLDVKREEDSESWKQFNSYYRKRTLKRLQKEKCVEIQEQNGEQTVMLTKNGKRKILKYALDDLVIDKPKKWDGRWRLILYDVAHNRKHLRDLFRGTLKGLSFYQLQESVWIYPYPCELAISFLREYYGVGNEVINVIAIKLEDDSPYRTYFHL